MSYEIVNVNKKVLVGTGIRTTNENMKAIEDIGSTWKYFFESNIFNSIENKVDNKTIGLYTDYESDYKGTYMFYSCVEVSEASSKNKDLKEIIIPSGKFAKFIGIGDIHKTVGQIWKEIWSTKLDRRYDYDFESYSYLENGIDQLIEIYIAIK